MSKCETIKGKCPICLLEQDVTLWNSVNTSLNPELKPKVLSQDILRLKCSGCKGILMLGYPLLYHDMGRQLMISFAPAPQERMPSPPPFMGDYQLRVVRSPNHLVEKILLFDAGLDDRAIEIIKLGVCRELISGYGDTLEKLKAVPLNASGLLFVGKTSVSATSDDKPADKLLFLLLLQQQPEMPIFVQVDFALHSDASSRLDKMPEARIEQGTWHAFDFDWACRASNTDTTPFKIELIVAPHLFAVLPAAASLWQKHVELFSKAQKHAESDQQDTAWSRIKRWFQ